MRLKRTTIPISHALLLLLALFLLASHHAAQCVPVREEQRAREARLSPLETPEMLEKVRFLMQDNLNPALNIWHTMAQQHEGRKLTMRNFFKTAGLLNRVNQEVGSFWGIKNNRLFRPNRDGPARYDPIIMAQEHKPNKDSAEWSLLSMWLALEEAIEAGIQFPDVIFMYNAGDQPMCNKYYPCHRYEHVPPLSVIGYNTSLLPPDGQPPADKPKTGEGDLVVPHFRFTGHSMAPSIHQHHPLILQLHSKGDPLWSSRRNMTRNMVPWEQKVPKLFFRGKGWCSYMKKYGCPRVVLSNLTIDHPQEMDAWSEGFAMTRLKRRAPRLQLFLPMANWTKYKYLAALDGIGASSRTITLYHLGSVVMKQRRTAYTEWFYQSLKHDVHHVEIYNTDTDAVEEVQRLKADDARARQIAETGTSFAKNYLVKDVMMVYMKALLQGYRNLFEDMDEYMAALGDPGNTSYWRVHIRYPSKDWRTAQPPPTFVPILPSTGVFAPPGKKRLGRPLRRPISVYHPENRSFTGTGSTGVGTDRYKRSKC